MFTRILRSLWAAVSFLLPWFFRFLWFSFTAMVSAFAGMAKGMADKSRENSGMWITRMNENGIPMEYNTFSAIFLTLVAFLMNLFGWILLSFVTVTVIRLLFGI